MRHSVLTLSFVLLLPLCLRAQEAPADEAWYRVTWRGVPVGFIHELWSRERGDHGAVLHLVREGQFSAGVETLRDLPYADFRIDATMDAWSYALHHARYQVALPVQPLGGAAREEYTLVQGEVRLSVDRGVDEGRTVLCLHTNEEGFPDVRQEVPPGEVILVPDVLPRILAVQPRPWKGTRRLAVLLDPDLCRERDPGRYVGWLRIEPEERGAEGTPVLLTVGQAASKVLLLDDAGRVRRSWTSPRMASQGKADLGAEPMDALVATRVAGETEAREGIAFVFARRNRRDPFEDPRTRVKPRRRFEPPPSNEGAPSGTAPVVEEDNKKDTDPVVVRAKGLLKEIERTFLGRGDRVAWSERVRRITERADRIRALLDAPLQPPQRDAVAQVLAQAKGWAGRAQTRERFYEDPPVVRGTVLHRKRVMASLKMGLLLFDCPFLADTVVPLEEPHSMVVIEPKQGAPGGNRTYVDGEAVSDHLSIGRVEGNGVWFQYDGEAIWMPVDGR